MLVTDNPSVAISLAKAHGDARVKRNWDTAKSPPTTDAVLTKRPKVNPSWAHHAHAKTAVTSVRLQFKVSKEKINILGQ